MHNTPLASQVCLATLSAAVQRSPQLSQAPNALPITHQPPSPAPQVGLATLSAAVQRSGGSLQHPGQQLDDELEERAASIEGGAGPEAFGFGFQCLTEDTPDVLKLFAEVRLGSREGCATIPPRWAGVGPKIANALTARGTASASHPAGKIKRSDPGCCGAGGAGSRAAARQA